MNVHVTGEEEPRSIDWSQVHNWRNVPYPENVVMMTQDEELAQEVVDAKEKEIKNLIENDVFESVQNENQPTMTYSNCTACFRHSPTGPTLFSYTYWQGPMIFACL